MEKLSKLAKEGWILEKFTYFFSLRLKKGEQQDIIYDLDYRREPDAEYFHFFENAGWKHVCSLGDWVHIFSAPSKSKPIYTDKETLIAKYEPDMKILKKTAYYSHL